MKKRFLCTVAAVMLMSSAISGCSLSGEPDASIAPVETASANNEPSPAYIVYGDYALLPGHAVYQNVYKKWVLISLDLKPEHHQELKNHQSISQLEAFNQEWKEIMLFLLKPINLFLFRNNYHVI